MITFSHRLYALFEPLLGPFERKDPVRETTEEMKEKPRSAEVILFGLAGLGGALLRN